MVPRRPEFSGFAFPISNFQNPTVQLQFETGRYVVAPDLPREWPVPSTAYDPAIGAEAYRGMVERAKLVG